MNYWHMQLHPGNAEWGRERELLSTLSLIGLGRWEEGGSQQEDFEKVMRIGDIVAVKCGATPIALVEVIGKYKEQDKGGDLDWFERRRKVKVLDWYRSEDDFQIASRGTLKRCKLDSKDKANTTKRIIEWHQKCLANQKMNKIIDLLRFKHQIILQGPPGTGKTWLAQKIAKELTKTKKLGSALEKIDAFFKSFDSTDSAVKLRRKEYEALLSEFHSKYPTSSLSELTLDQYAIGTGENDSFCWWIERGLKRLGSYSPGTSRSYLIYWSKDREEYSKHTELVKNIEDDEEAMKRLAETLADFISTRSFEKASKYFGNSLFLKLLHSYYPDEYMPINSVPCLNSVLKLFGIDPARMTPLEKNIKVQELFLQKKNQFSADVTNYDFMHFLFDNFDIKGTISLESSEVVVAGEYKVIQFHPAYSYEDFVRGIVAQANDDNQIEYRVENKILVEFAGKALDNPSADYVLIIDEINRANLPAVLGELIHALEYRYDEKEPEGSIVESMYALKGDGESSESKQLKLPKNLYIIGTMNTADRSVGHIDYAIRRRFSFVEMLPDLSVVEREACSEGIALFKTVAAIFCENYPTPEGLALCPSEFVSPEFRPQDIMIGHSYFLEKDIERLRLRLRYEIIPILEEYVKDGVLLKSAGEKIAELHV